MSGGSYNYLYCHVNGLENQRDDIQRNHVTVPITYADVVRMYRAAMGQPYQPYVDPLPPVPVPSASDRSAYAGFQLTGRYALPESVVDACPPNAPLARSWP